MPKTLLGTLCLAASLALVGCGSKEQVQPTPVASNPAPGAMPASAAPGTTAQIQLASGGTIELELYPDLAPITVANFKKLADKKFYDGLTFHRVEPGFVVQGGDPNGNGSGGPGWTIKGEFSTAKHHVRGTLAMARTPDPDSAGSQFYICLAPAPFLDGKYAIFGQVTKGMELVDQIKVGDKMTSVTVK
jgi:peptidylprolyl isomerase/peptidyl-prolyl cis-trans isomerase B (cyclophilin B)